MKVLEINNLCKKYPTFTLDNVSFSFELGYIMGFIGRNGAGKTTTVAAKIKYLVDIKKMVKNHEQVKKFGRIIKWS